MSLALLPLSDVYFTPENLVLLRINDALLPPETLIAPEYADELAKHLTYSRKPPPNIPATIRNVQNNLLKDCRKLHQAVSQKTGADFSLEHDGFIYRVNVSQSPSGPNCSLRRLEGQVPELEELGLPKNAIRVLDSLAREQGLILLSGPTGSGKTTTASSLLVRFIKQFGEFAYTIEDPPEYKLSGFYKQENSSGYCLQTEPPKGAWAAGLANALRSRPRYILVGEIRDPQCASELLRASNSGHLVFSTIHAQSPADALVALVKYASPILSEQLARDQLSQGLICSIHQTIRKGKLFSSFLFAGPLASGVRNKISDNKFVMLSNDIERQSIRISQNASIFS